MTNSEKRHRAIRRHRGAYQVRYRDPSGAQRSRSFRLLTEAKDFLEGVRTDVRRGQYQDPSAGKVRLAAAWPRLLAASPHLRSATLAQYESLARNHILPRLGGIPIGSLSRLDVEGWVGTLIAADVRPATISASLRVLRRMLSAAEAGGIIGRNPARSVRVPQPGRPEMRFLSASELLTVADAAGGRDRALVLLLGLCGLRIGEALGLRVEDVDLLRRRALVTKSASEVRGKVLLGPTKTGASRSVPLPRIVATALEESLGSDPIGYLFPDSDGGPIRRTNWRRRVWMPAVRRAGIEPPLPRIHDLRHTAVALSVEQGAHPKTIQDLLGHSSIQVTLGTYGHLFPSLAEQLAEALDARMRATDVDQVWTNRGPTVADLSAGTR